MAQTALTSRIDHACQDEQATAGEVLADAGFWVHEHRTAAEAAHLDVRLRQALEAVEPGSAAGLRLRARIAGARDHVCGEHGRIGAVLAAARRCGDAAALAEALHVAHQCLLGPDDAAARRAVAAELLRAPRPADRLLGLLWRTVDDHLDADPRAGQSLTELRGQLHMWPHPQVSGAVEAIEVMLNVRAGRLDEAERRLTSGPGHAGGPDVVAGAVQLVAVRWFQGRMHELAPHLAGLVAAPGVHAGALLTAAQAVAAALAGDRRTAAAALARLAVREPVRDGDWLAAMHGMAEAAYLLADAPVAARVRELLLPYADRPMLAGNAVACFGSAHHALGVAALTTGQLDLAVRHFSAAVRHNTALAHWPAVVASRVRHAQALTLRGAPGDAVAAQRARDAAAEEGLPLPAQERTGRLRCTRQGQHWRVELGRRSVVVAHSVGMLQLSMLVANPGQEITAAELSAGAALAGAALERLGAQPVLDGRAVQQYRQRLNELAADIEDLDAACELERAAAARRERDWLLDELGAAVGLAGRVRGFADGAERARIAVGKAIRRAVSRIELADPSIGAHVRTSVRTGSRCSYRP